MNTTLRRFAAPASALASLLAITACSTSDEGKGSTQVTRAHASETNTYTITTTVRGIDCANRRVTLTTPEGEQRRFALAPQVRNFDQLRVGDHVKTILSREVALTLNRTDGPASTSQGTAITRAPEGSTASGAIPNTRQLTGRIVAINDRDVSLWFADGNIRKIRVDKDVDLSSLRPGYFVTARVSDAIAMAMEEPDAPGARSVE